MVALLVAYNFLAFRQDPVIWHRVSLPMQPSSNTALFYQGPVDPLAVPKKSPKLFGESKAPLEFDWLLQGLVQVDNAPPRPYFNVYSQEHKTKGDLAPSVARMLLRLWDFNYKKIRTTHSPQFENGIVDVYLCFGGKAGGEQLFGVDQVVNPNTKKTVDIKVNTIYIYDLPSFTDPVEMAREVAHEYGHATLYPIGGYKEPEDWANGFLGEKLFLRWMRDAMVSGELGPVDAMGADKASLDKWVATNVDALVVKAAQVEPTQTVMLDMSAKGMDEYIGLALYIDTIYSDGVFARSIKMTGSYDAKDYPASILLAAEEPDQVKLTIPSYLYGKNIWIPLGTGKLSGTKALKKNAEGWAQIKAGPNPVFVYNSH